MTFNELENQVFTFFPEAQIGFDNDGQIVIYTNLTLDSDGKNLVRFSSDPPVLKES